MRKRNVTILNYKNDYADSNDILNLSTKKLFKLQSILILLKGASIDGFVSCL